MTNPMYRYYQPSYAEAVERERDELRKAAEYWHDFADRANATADKFGIDIRNLERECDELRAEIKREKQWATRVINRQNAEVERLKAQVAARENYGVTQEQRAMRAEAENERLRAALERIASWHKNSKSSVFAAEVLASHKE